MKIFEIEKLLPIFKTRINTQYRKMRIQDTHIEKVYALSRLFTGFL